MERIKKYLAPLLMLVIFETVAVTLWLTKDNLFYLINFSYIGLEFDYEANAAAGKETLLSLPTSKVKVALIPTNEELVIARDTMHIVQDLED